MRVGVLALQGAFAEHEAALEKLGVEHFEIRQRRDLESWFDGLILPGGESTVMKKLLQDLDLWEPLAQRIQQDSCFWNLRRIASAGKAGGRRNTMLCYYGNCSETQCLWTAIGQFLC